MSDTWKLWEGETVDAKFPLVRFLGGSERTGVFQTERREGGQAVKAAIKLVLINPPDGEVQLSRWKRAAALSHPHLTPIYESGRFELRGVPLVYAVMEFADENLAEVIPGRALTSDEAREMLAPVVDALAYLHGQGFVHGHMKPANFMACGDQLKISSDGLQRAGEPQDANGKQSPYDPPEMARGVLPMAALMSPAADVWSLGMVLVEALVQNLPTARTGEQKDPAVPESLAEPFLDIARHCLMRFPEGRWTVAQIADRLAGRAVATSAAPAAITPSASIPLQANSPRRTRARSPQPSSWVRRNAAPVAVGLGLALVAILAGPKLFRPRAAAPQVTNGQSEQADAPSAPSQLTPSSQESPTKAYEPSAAAEERSSRVPVAVPAAIHSETPREEETSSMAKAPAGPAAHGEVAQQVLPNVLPSAKGSIQGRINVSVKVNVDRSGNVEDAELASPGPSKYFARAALQAAQNWKFKPPTVGGQGVLSTWLLHFQFRRDETTVVPTQEMP
jgi:TonB family protein